MKSVLLMLLLTLALFCVGCSGDDEVVAPPAEVYEAHADISNFLVGNGTVDTRMDVRLSANVRVAEDINPLNTVLDADLLLGSEQQTTPVELADYRVHGAALEGLLVGKRR